MHTLLCNKTSDKTTLKHFFQTVQGKRELKETFLSRISSMELISLEV